MRRTIVVGLVLLNGILFAALITPPAETQIIPLGLWDCCKELGNSPDRYCCHNCCWFIENCDRDEDCLLPRRSSP